MRLVTQSDLNVTELPGIWHCRYWFPSNTHDGEDVSEYYVRIDQTADGFTLHSLPNRLKAYLQAHFTVESNLATGMWLENTSPTGEFGGMIYSGVFQLIIAEDAKSLHGRWVGIGRETDGSGAHIYEGRWEIDYAGAAEADVPAL
ncbi:MAG TPA: hypothetical protein VHC98_01025 [Candidatus Saccharimonadales bacterium]|nr:hypothetical protein [Candidatus Saccharimonadales bacterium]